MPLPIDSDDGFAEEMRRAEQASGALTDEELYGRPRRSVRRDEWASYDFEVGRKLAAVYEHDRQGRRRVR